MLSPSDVLDNGFSNLATWRYCWGRLPPLANLLVAGAALLTTEGEARGVVSLADHVAMHHGLLVNVMGLPEGTQSVFRPDRCLNVILDSSSFELPGVSTGNTSSFVVFNLTVRVCVCVRVSLCLPPNPPGPPCCSPFRTSGTSVHVGARTGCPQAALFVRAERWRL
jgi:hypothetical protein